MIEVGRANKRFLIVITLPLFYPVPLDSYRLRRMLVPQEIRGKLRSLQIVLEKNYSIEDPRFTRYFLTDEEYIRCCVPMGRDLACSHDRSCKILIAMQNY